MPATEVKDDLAGIVMRREELETLLAGTKEEPVLLHPNMAAQYRKQVANLAQVLNREENRGEAAALLRSLVDRIELRPNHDGSVGSQPLRLKSGRIEEQVKVVASPTKLLGF